MKKALSAITVFCILAFPAAAQGEFAGQNEFAAQGGLLAQNKPAKRNPAVQKELKETIDRRDFPRLQALLDAGADPGMVVDGSSLLIRAIQRRNVPAVQLLLDRGADPNRADARGSTAAHHAADLFDIANTILRLLAVAGARFDALDGEKRTPLQIAAGWGRKESFSFILAWEQKNVPGFSGSFADRKSYLMSLWSGGSTFFSSAIGALLDTGEPVDGIDSDGRNAGWYSAHEYGSGPFLTGRLMKAGVRFDVTDNEGVSPLIESLNRRDTGVFMLILRWEETNSPGFAGAAANRGMYLAAAMVRLWGDANHGEEIKALLAAGADPAALISGGEKVYLRRVRGDYVPLLVENGTPVDIQNKDGRTFLMEAASRWGELVLYLLEAKADPNIRDKEGRTALMEAQTSGTARLLLDYGADPRAADHDGRTALHHHGYYGNKEQLALLIRAGADIEAPDNEGLTPFLYAAFQGTSQGMSDLLDLGADPNKKSPENKTALLLYLENNAFNVFYQVLPSMVRRLLDMGAEPAEKDMAGNSPLLTAFREKSNHDNVREIRDILVSAADKEQVSAAKSAVRAENFPGRFTATVPLLLLLAYIGISIWIREGAYRDDPGSNWMGTINAFVTGCGVGAPLGFFTFASLPGIAGELGGALAAVLFAAPAGGLIGGIAMAAIPSARRAFKKEPLLYYLPSAAAVIVFTIAAVRIWLG
ncbi:MAG: ankyrin repeat domain-containing protein [Treponema sp.]|jgi:ankyrin repeat protein|nr:ankyrin repeat domain-containing protein [Treponema sp.]